MGGAPSLLSVTQSALDKFHGSFFQPISDVHGSLQQKTKSEGDAEEGDPAFNSSSRSTNTNSEGKAVDGQKETQKFNYLSCTPSPQ